ncbi:MAG: PilZ domain-containing protein, partial [Deltaproteobacteria bacterium]|nr:PilZ domain-containing protein [Deltaproteobacteria bacterium]
MEKRRQKRAHQRLICQRIVGSQRHPAIVRDISTLGMFVQTRARPEPSSLVKLIFPADGSRPEIRVEAGVARARVVPPRLQASVPEGVGLET